MPDLTERLAEAHRAASIAAQRKHDPPEIPDDDAPLAAHEAEAVREARRDLRARRALREVELTADLPAGMRIREVRAGAADGPLTGYLLEQLTGSTGTWRLCGRYSDLHSAKGAAPGFIAAQQASDPNRLRSVVGR